MAGRRGGHARLSDDRGRADLYATLGGIGSSTSRAGSSLPRDDENDNAVHHNGENRASECSETPSLAKKQMVNLTVPIGRRLQECVDAEGEYRDGVLGGFTFQAS
jgi:hypothetical protein